MREGRKLLAVWCCAAAGMVFTTGGQAHGQLRIATYNLGGAVRPGLDTVLSAIGNESRNGIQKPIDVLALQELDTNGNTTTALVSLLNGIYGAGSYSAAPIPGNAVSTGGGLPGLVYRTSTVSYLGSQAFGTVDFLNQPRSSMRFQLRPVGYDAAADFYVFSNHYKSDLGEQNENRRNLEAIGVRANSDALGDVHAIYAGDFNVYRSTEPMYQTLLSPGPGQAFDPIDMPGPWTESGSAAEFKSIHTQNPVNLMDDRFDFQLVTGELLDGEGMSYLAGSYHAFGNNGTHVYKASITTGTGAAPDVLSALASVTDHLPVVADYQLPAKMSVTAGAIPSIVSLGAAASVNVMVQNVAAAMVAAGADELDYTVSVTGSLIGGAVGLAPTLGPANSHSITLDTSSPGLKTGSIVVTAMSQGAANALFTLPVMFTVGGGGGVTRQVIAKDDFDAPLGLVDYSQTPAAGTYAGTPASAFHVLQAGVSASIPFALVDDSTGSFPSDAQGIVNPTTKTDAWFGVTDTVDNAMPMANPGGEGVATWTFDVAGVSALEVSIDMGAMGDFEATGVNADRFNWAYSIDGAEFQPLFTSSVNEATSASYTMADGKVVMIDDPLFMTDRENETVQLSNTLQTLTTAIPGIGDTLLVRLTAKTDGTSEAYVVDNIAVTGLVPTFNVADFDENGMVDAADLAAWRGGFGQVGGATKSQGDANGDGNVDGTDFLVLQAEYGSGSAAFAAGQPVPEPRAALLAALMATGWWGVRRRR